jgi:hypothetical protein
MNGIRLLVLAASCFLAASLQAGATDPALECIYRRAARADLEVAWEMNRRPHAPNADEDAAMDRDALASHACAAQHGWSDSRTVIALTYAMGQAGLDKAVRELDARGISPEIIDMVAADIGERGRSALAGRPSDVDFQFVAAAVAANLARTHAPVRSGSPELAEAGRIIARGLHAMSIRDQAVAAFAAP